MTITYWLNGKKATADVAPGLMLYDFLRNFRLRAHSIDSYYTAFDVKQLK